MNESLRYELDNMYVRRFAIMRYPDLAHSYNTPGIRTSIVCPGHILTPLFSSIELPSNPIFKFVAPSIAPVTVVKSIITALDAQQSRTIYLPFYTNLTPALRMVPSYVRDLAQKVWC